MARGVPVAAVGLVVVFLAAAAHGAAAKGCTNTLPGLTASHTERAAAQLRRFAPPDADAPRLPEVLDHGHDHDHKQHLTPTDESTWMALMPRRFLGSTAPPREAFDWLMLYRKLRGGTPVDGGAAGAFLSEASLHDVRLEPGTVYWQAQQTNLEYLLLLDVDRLIRSFRMQAGLTAPGTP